MKSLTNFRDLGGLKTTCGRKVKLNKLLRAGELSKLHPEDKTNLLDRGLKLIIDLRSSPEISSRPNDVIEGTDYLQIDVLGPSGPSLEELLHQMNPENSDAFMYDVYQNLITSPLAVAGYKEFLKACLRNVEGALLFHCMAGKDRTGFAAALILKILGVSDEDIYEDFLKTVEARRLANDKIVDSFRQKGLGQEQLEALAIVFSVKKSYLETAFKAIAEKYGDFQAYVMDGLGFGEAEIEQLKMIYLE